MITSFILMQLFEAIEIIYFLSQRKVTKYIFVTMVFTVLAFLALTAEVIPVSILCKIGLSLNNLLSTRKESGISIYSSWCCLSLPLLFYSTDVY